ncbi:type II secretion system F family protein [Actinobacillus equuli subsp. haemolyticus]|uniref:Type II secretion system F family protein n=1 Tax=Actinobacillus equuli subsp. equuli TaxID=202947 RepID=A0A9X4JCQ4_ACTEU|nr:type II secretion system F family protein [Actinobacillus equuli]MDE8035052.1 type II secretion system F family protein [Actinobacillus equuli subsp. equuli]MDG4948509.1 type II secretion system F family protein [Actinobacillus equuli subsp. haemolyticus]WGE42831.1 type II secretion system F family protein [Actinobacillus equuli subsp. haemolyticus]WGE53549.1 type II secretion system F family protein [Actinobacillus equuli subsp. haemolyticus]WGE64010.1 type II secretion system F family pro
MNPILFFLGIILFGGFVLIVAFSHKKKIDRNREILEGVRPKDNVEDNSQKGKTKQQIELELLLVNKNPLLKFLGLVDKNIKVKMLVISLLTLVNYFISEDQTTFLLGCAVVVVLAIMLPSITIGIILKSKIKRIMNDIPGFIDLVAVNVQTGISIEAAFKQVAIDFEHLNADLTYVILRIMRKAELTSLGAALQDLAISLPTKEIRMFCTVMQQSLNFGSSLYEHLTQLSADIREMQLLVMEEKLGTLAAKMSIPLILFIMFPIIILIVAPGAMRVLPHVF